MDKDSIQALALTRINELSEYPINQVDCIFIGPSSILDSAATVSIIAELEIVIQEAFGVELDLFQYMLNNSNLDIMVSELIEYAISQKNA